MENVFPQPPRCPRLEQYTLWPRTVSPPAVWASLPKARLCRFKLPAQPQWGHGDCLRKKVGASTPARRAQNDKADGTSPLLPKCNRSRRAFLHGTSRRRDSVQEDLEKRQDGTERHSTHIAIVTLPRFTIPIRHKHGTSYDGTAALNTQPRPLPSAVGGRRCVPAPFLKSSLRLHSTSSARQPLTEAGFKSILHL